MVRTFVLILLVQCRGSDISNAPGHVHACAALRCAHAAEQICRWPLGHKSRLCNVRRQLPSSSSAYGCVVICFSLSSRGASGNERAKLSRSVRVSLAQNRLQIGFESRPPSMWKQMSVDPASPSRGGFGTFAARAARWAAFSSAACRSVAFWARRRSSASIAE